MSKHTVKLANRQEVSVYDKDISDHVRQIEKYRQLCLANSRRQRQQELVQLQEAHERSRFLDKELFANALRKNDSLEQFKLHLTLTPTGVCNVHSQSSAAILVQQLKQRASLQQKWDRHVQRLQKPPGMTGHEFASKQHVISRKQIVNSDQATAPTIVDTTSQAKWQGVDWRAISAHILPEITEMRCQGAGATVCFVCRRIAPRKTNAQARNDLASLIQRNNIIKLRCRLNVSRRSLRSPLGVMLSRNRRLGRQQAREPTEKRKQGQRNSLPPRKRKRKRTRQNRRPKPNSEASGNVGSTPAATGRTQVTEKCVEVGTDSLFSVSSQLAVQVQAPVPASVQPLRSASESDTISRLFLGLTPADRRPQHRGQDTAAQSSVATSAPHLWQQVIASYSQLTGLDPDQRDADAGSNRKTWEAYHKESPAEEDDVLVAPPSSPTQFLLQIDEGRSVN